MKIASVRIKYGGQVMTYDCGQLCPSLGDWVLVSNNNQLYLGCVVTSPFIADLPCTEELEASEKQSSSPDETTNDGSNQEKKCFCSSKEKNGHICSCLYDGVRKVIRIATAADLAKHAENEQKEREAFEYCLSRVAVQKLEMKLVAVEIVFDGSKTIFYYTADERVDFRLLVKELVSRFRTRIEMRQIGVRHEARMVGGLGVCGRSFCCSAYLSDFLPVSVKMAKEQNISLSPSKISGVCGRLMCCLAYEHYGKDDDCCLDDDDVSDQDDRVPGDKEEV